jgi:signal transduction histidine kinase/DNA-binding response OmpR family regulator
MMVSGLSSPAQEDQTASVPDELVRESLRVLLPSTLLALWVWAAIVMVLDERRLPTAILLFALAAVGCWAGHSLQRRRLRLAVGCYLGTVTAFITLFVFAFPGTASPYVYLLAVLIAAVLTRPHIMWSLALVCVALVIAGAWAKHTPFLWEVCSPVLLILVTALTSWLGLFRLNTALDWMLAMTRQAEANAREARERRAEARSALKSLDEAYVRLERANEALLFAREAAEKAYRFKAEFVANVSHELRTPLNLIVGFSEMVATAPESYRGTPLPSEYRGDVMAIYRSARHLGDLINDVLDLSQLEAGRLPLNRELEDLGETVRQAVDMVRGLAEAKGLRLEVELPADLPRLRLDRTRIRQVLLNLLTNATRFTDQGWIRIRAWVDRPLVRVTVEDSGRGIDPGKIERAFQAFGQLSDDEARRGTGLGLALSRRFVEMHGGTMWIESRVGAGTQVGLTLPLPSSGLDVSLALVGTTPGQGLESRPRVLVLHDDPRILNLLQHFVEGYTFRLAESVTEATSILQEGLPAAAIVDQEWSARWVEVLAGCPGCMQLPCLTLPMPGLRRRGALLGAVDYLAKPLTREQLGATFARLGQAPRCVLIVDDDPSFVRLLTRMLQAYDPSLRVLEASGGEEGLAVARQQHPDLLLLDMLMPEVSGYDVLRALQQDAALCDIRVIILSAQAIEQEAASVMGGMHLDRATGLSVTEVLQTVQAVLAAVTAPGAVARASAAGRQ